MTDKDFIRDATKRWSATLALADKKDAKDGAVIIALWATMNVDRLLTIADRNIRNAPARQPLL